MDKLYIFDKWGKKRKAEWIICALCYKKVLTRTFTNRPNIFCSTICSQKSRYKRKIILCLNCGIKFNKVQSRIQKINFCNRKCKDDYSQSENHPRWLGGLWSYRDRAIKKYGFKCASKNNCPLKDMELHKIMYEVDHINGNHQDNKIENLQILYIWCHKVKTYKQVWGIGTNG